ncbi:hypothetical protein Dda_6801 [Drechslerella dactyloides]|uniref:Clr5 domain-containing protein n=1 Tax=Drechslerella dactyloides TaxID=74499 RepID=A0AAD6IUD4_DREDA|nr:hypothetical protein Dda_6801 [Drechslerella dactyloides]
MSGERAAQHTASEWEYLKDVIIRMWIEEDLTREDICQRLASEHNFLINWRQLETRLRKWKVKKNIPTAEAELAVRSVLDRRASDRSSIVKIEDLPLPEKRTQRLVQRRRRGAVENESAEAATMNLTVSTPPDETSDSTLDHEMEYGHVESPLVPAEVSLGAYDPSEDVVTIARYSSIPWEYLDQSRFLDGSHSQNFSLISHGFQAASAPGFADEADDEWYTTDLLLVNQAINFLDSNAMLTLQLTQSLSGWMRDRTLFADVTTSNLLALNETLFALSWDRCPGVTPLAQRYEYLTSHIPCDYTQHPNLLTGSMATILSRASTDASAAPQTPLQIQTIIATMKHLRTMQKITCRWFAEVSVMLYRTARLAEAEDILTFVLNINVIDRLDDAYHVCHAQIELAQLLSRTNRLPEAHALLDTLTLSESTFVATAPNTPALLWRKLDLIAVLRRLSRFADAENILRNCIHTIMTEYPDDLQLHVNFANEYGFLARKQRRYDEAEGRFRAAVASAEVYYGVRHYYTLTAYCFLAQAQAQQGKVQDVRESVAEIRQRVADAELLASERVWILSSCDDYLRVEEVELEDDERG